MFKKFAVTVLLVVACFLVTGCYSVKMVAPPDGDVKLMSPTQSAAYTKKITNWYALWGLVPIINAEDGVQKAIKENNLKEVRVETKQTFIDGLISYFLGFATIGTTTTILEGN